MHNRYVLRRAVFGLLAATLGGMAASAGVVHLRSRLTDTAQATTFSCPVRAKAQPVTRHDHEHVREPVSSTVCMTTRPSTGRIASSTSVNQPPVIAVIVPAPGRSRISAAKAIDGRSRRSDIFVDPGSVSYGSVIYCSHNCPTDAGQSGGAVVPVTIVNVPTSGDKRKTATKP